MATALRLTRAVSLAALVLQLTAPAAQAADGASAMGTAYGDFVIGCTTCPHFGIPLTGTPDQLSGGAGASTAGVDYSGTPVYTAELSPYSLAGSVGYRATAAFSGVLATPLLGAKAWSVNEQAVILDDPAHIPVGIDLYSAYTEARTERTYTYIGSTAASYTFTFQMTGSVSGLQASLFGSAAIYTGLDPYFETGLIDFGSASSKGIDYLGTSVPTLQTFDVTVNVAPSQSFVLIAKLSALTGIDYASNDPLADGSHTLLVTAISGDTSLLVAAPVPEPSGWLLMLAGVSWMGLRSRRS